MKFSTFGSRFALAAVAAPLAIWGWAEATATIKFTEIAAKAGIQTTHHLSLIHI